MLWVPVFVCLNSSEWCSTNITVKGIDKHYPASTNWIRLSSKTASQSKLMVMTDSIFLPTAIVRGFLGECGDALRVWGDYMNVIWESIHISFFALCRFFFNEWNDEINTEVRNEYDCDDFFLPRCNGRISGKIEKITC